MKASGLKSITDIWTSLNRRSLRDVLEELSESEAKTLEEEPRSKFTSSKFGFVVWRCRIGNYWNKIGDCEDGDYMKAFSAKTLKKCEAWVKDDIMKTSWDHAGLMTPRGIVSRKGSKCATYVVGASDFMLKYLVEPV